MFLGGAGLAWLANPLLITAWMTFKYPRFSVWFSIFAVIFAGSFLLFTHIPTGGIGDIQVYQRHVGYWLWLSSMIVILMGNGIQLVDLYIRAPLKIP